MMEEDDDAVKCLGSKPPAAHGHQQEEKGRLPKVSQIVDEPLLAPLFSGLIHIIETNMAYDYSKAEKLSKNNGWTKSFDDFFHPENGPGRGYRKPSSKDALSEFKSKVVAIWEYNNEKYKSMEPEAWKDVEEHVHTAIEQYATYQDTCQQAEKAHKAKKEAREHRKAEMEATELKFKSVPPPLVTPAHSSSPFFPSSMTNAIGADPVATGHCASFVPQAGQKPMEGVSTPMPPDLSTSEMDTFLKPKLAEFEKNVSSEINALLNSHPGNKYEKLKAMRQQHQYYVEMKDTARATRLKNEIDKLSDSLFFG